MKLFQSLIILLAITFFTAYASQKIVPATPAIKPVNVQGSSENLHSMLILLAQYKKYDIGNYLRYINMFDNTLKRIYSDPDYLGRMRNIVDGKMLMVQKIVLVK